MIADQFILEVLRNGSKCITTHGSERGKTKVLNVKIIVRSTSEHYIEIRHILKMVNLRGIGALVGLPAILGILIVTGNRYWKVSGNRTHQYRFDAGF